MENRRGEGLSLYSFEMVMRTPFGVMVDSREEQTLAESAEGAITVAERKMTEWRDEYWSSGYVQGFVITAEGEPWTTRVRPVRQARA